MNGIISLFLNSEIKSVAFETLLSLVFVHYNSLQIQGLIYEKLFIHI